jgi:hypothetical protein
MLCGIMIWACVFDQAWFDTQLLKIRGDICRLVEFGSNIFTVLLLFPPEGLLVIYAMLFVFKGSHPKHPFFACFLFFPIAVRPALKK